MGTEPTKLSIISAGMITSVGSNTEAVAMAVNAGIARLTESCYYNKRNRPIRMASIPDDSMAPLDEALSQVRQLSSSHARILQISAHALMECLSHYTPDEALPVFMSCPEIIPGTTSRVMQGFLNHLKVQTQANIDLENSRLLFTGRAGGFQAVEIAFKYLNQTGNNFALIGGADSYKYCLQQLSKLDDEERLLVEQSTDGFIPGEAGGFVLLASDEALQKYNLTARLAITYPSCTKEPGHRYSTETYLGTGLANAFHTALDYAPNIQVDAIYSSLNGEAFGAKELGVSMLRNNQRLGDSVDVKHPADSFGDIGAAFGPVLLGLMSSADHCSALACCSSDGPDRSVLCGWKN